ncbi:M64 family metallopeptidase [Legionella shakespearei]|uniref:IgA Peptidase M64 n=1 Tax=Legionella shakespearei DSM 23087 TaxID=1122169 RepID=A0A0W0YVH6_9GAMM|nr:M64 family metallopeptidase [Legionella shakespearei]KTD60856.1 IgA Peptidase M64 [Legionella shakespearei DSM 23087]
MPIFYIILLALTQLTYANPYWDAHKVPSDSSFKSSQLIKYNVNQLKTVKQKKGIDVLRIQIDWLEESDSYSVGKLVVESSGTPALLARSIHKPKWGSYLGVLKDQSSGKEYYDSVGTGKEYRKLARAINLRFPMPTSDMVFELYAENPQSGIMEKVIEKNISANEPVRDDKVFPDLEVKELSLSAKEPSLRVNIYAEGYAPGDKNKFWQQSLKTVTALKGEHFPGVEYMSFYAVFNPSNKRLGEAVDLGTPVPEFDSFLGLYYPYWDNFGRWYHIVYPTREDKFRQGLAAAPYDYPIVLVNNSGYWGVGNYMSHTAIPAGNSVYFTYLLLHEFGHFFGLNEEYEGGGRTELEFAPDIQEPWSQNITFLSEPNYSGLKWNSFVSEQTQIPTPDSDWHSKPPVYGAYHGGYGDSVSNHGVSHKPGFKCVMESHASFCDICTKGIMDVILFDLGVS